MENLERTWFKCQTCGIECSNEVKAQYGSLYDGKPYTWDGCTTCALECIECGELVERGNAATIGHSKHWFCWAMHCSKKTLATAPRQSTPNRKDTRYIRKVT